MTPFTTPDSFTTRPTLRGSFGMSASTHWLATASAQAVLERGGNAFDAAVAGAFVLHIVEPHLNGPGGDMTGVFATAENPSKPVVLMGQGPAPAAATREHYLAEGLELVPAPVRSPPPFPPPSTPGFCCCATTGRGSWAMLSLSRSAMPGTDTRSLAA